MGWSAETAVNALLDTVRLYNSGVEETCDCLRKEAQSAEFVSAMAAGIRAQTIVELSHRISPYTIALAAAARRTGGRLVCILFEARSLEESKRVLNKFPDLESYVELKVGDSDRELLNRYKNIDFLLADAKIENLEGLLKTVDMNARRSAVVINNLFETERLSGWFYGKPLPKKTGIRRVVLPIGRGMEVNKIGRNEPRERNRKSSANGFAEFVETSKSRWFVAVDRKTREEHFFRVKTKYGASSKRVAMETA